MKIKGIIFDVDGLMVDSEILFFELLRDIMAEFGHDLTLEAHIATIGISLEDGIRIFEETYPGIDGKQVFAMRTQRYPQAVAQGRLRAKPGLLELLDELERRGMPYSVASSNTDVIVRNNLKGAKVADRVKTIVHAGMVEHVKPAPDLFLKAAQLMGLKPEECLVLEDSAAGIQAAHAAGIPSIIIPDLLQPAEETLDLCLEKMDTLYDVIEFLKQEEEKNEV